MEESMGRVLPLVLGNDPSEVAVAAGQGVELPLLDHRVKATAAHRLVATNLSVGKIVLDPTLE
jgi:hypothetical protein